MNVENIIRHGEECSRKRKKFRWWKIDGPWMKEPDRLQWKYKGLDCLIVRQSHMFTLCGYVGVKHGHPFYKKHHDKLDLHAHGGLSFSGHCGGAICHITQDATNRTWWLGFDHSHLGDALPGMLLYREEVPGLKDIYKSYHSTLMPDDHYSTIQEVKQEVEQLASLVAREKVNKFVAMMHKVLDLIV